MWGGDGNKEKKAEEEREEEENQREEEGRKEKMSLDIFYCVKFFCHCYEQNPDKNQVLGKCFLWLIIRGDMVHHGTEGMMEK